MLQHVRRFEVQDFLEFVYKVYSVLGTVVAVDEVDLMAGSEALAQAFLECFELVEFKLPVEDIALDGVGEHDACKFCLEVHFFIIIFNYLVILVKQLLLGFFKIILQLWVIL